MLNKLTILSLNSSQIKTFSFEYCSDIMHYPNKKISTTLKEVFRTVCKEWQLHFFCSWRIIIEAYFFFPGCCLQLMMCVCVCVIVMQFETTSSIIVYPKSCSKCQVLHLFQWGTYIISSVHVVPNTVWFGKAQIFQGMGIVPYMLRWCQKVRRSASNPMSNSTIKTFFSHFLDATGSE